MNEATALMTPPRDHNFALRRWLKSPIVVPDSDSTELSSYEPSASVDTSKKDINSKDGSAINDEWYEPVAPFRTKLTDEQLCEAIQALLRQGIPMWDSGDVVSCTMLYLKFAREQADDCPEIKQALGDGKFAVLDESDRCLGIRLRQAFDAVLARAVPKTLNDNDSDRTPSPPLPPPTSPPPPPPPIAAKPEPPPILYRGLFATM